MNRMVLANLFKLTKSVALRVSFSLCCTSAIVLVSILHSIYNGDMKPEMITNFSLLSDNMLVSLLGGVLIGGIVCGDFESKNIHSEIACGKGRFAIVMAKTITCAFAIFYILIPYTVVTVGALGIKVNMSQYFGIPSQFFSIVTSGNITPVKAMFLDLGVMFMYIGRLSICLPVAFKFKKSIPVIIVGFISSFAFDLVNSLVKDIAVVSDVFKHLPFSEMFNLTVNASAGDIIEAIVSNVIFIAIMVAVSYALFRKDEIK